MCQGILHVAGKCLKLPVLFAQDVFSFGTLLWEVTTWKMPFAEDSPEQVGCKPVFWACRSHYAACMPYEKAAAQHFVRASLALACRPCRLRRS